MAGPEPASALLAGRARHAGQAGSVWGAPGAPSFRSGCCDDDDDTLPADGYRWSGSRANAVDAVAREAGGIFERGARIQASASTVSRGSCAPAPHPPDRRYGAAAAAAPPSHAGGRASGARGPDLESRSRCPGAAGGRSHTPAGMAGRSARQEVRAHVAPSGRGAQPAEDGAR
ncbi:hypothetical protein VTK73DRAFT_5971 [Phialemonium thermophilum]|uniref:Uncharacterized protein n=1 Tax=Phialemonium thermophilum TaxID=223376 RepID=A0ABR3V081_9PEZI